MSHDFYHDPAYKEKQSEITKRYWKEGRYNFLKKPLLIKICKNPNCLSSFNADLQKSRIFCSSRCSAIVNNSLRTRQKLKKNCLECKKVLSGSETLYCSNRCQQDYKYNLFIIQWQKGEIKGGIGINTKSISGHVRKYILKKYDFKCSECSWNKKHPITGHIPLEIDHIDGNADNNLEENLRVLCPNCHSLTFSFRNLNKGKGRSWRITYLNNSKK